MKVAAMCFRCMQPFYAKPSNKCEYLQYGEAWLCDRCLSDLDGIDRRTILRRLSEALHKPFPALNGRVKELLAKVGKQAYLRIRIIPLLEPPDYLAVSAEILAEIAWVHRPIGHGTQRHCGVSSSPSTTTISSSRYWVVGF
jgi:hypothetical protein